MEKPFLLLHFVLIHPWGPSFFPLILRCKNTVVSRLMDGTIFTGSNLLWKQAGFPGAIAPANEYRAGKAVDANAVLYAFSLFVHKYEMIVCTLP
ncbi:hypothetical protein DCM91_05485 [Chitinophaga costaii]|nr:hypothetical protein DCM91_05485 [Chitinophaga costaii]